MSFMIWYNSSNIVHYWLPANIVAIFCDIIYSGGEIKKQKTKNGSSAAWIVLIIILIAALGFGALFLFRPKKEDVLSPSASPGNNATKSLAGSWQDGAVAIAGQYADAEVIALADGKYRMYYAVEPEVTNNELEVYSALSSDGINWEQEDGIRKTFAVFPDVVKLSDGRWRLYFQNAGVIKSAVSSDGLNWQDEQGVRIDAKEEGFTLESVGAQSTTLLENGTWMMVYRGVINEPYKTAEKLPNNTTSVYFWATSKDGLTFEKRGVAFDARNETLLGAADGAEWVKWDDGELRLYFWSYKGVYHSVFENNKFAEPVFDFTNKTDTQAKFAPNPPADPTLINIGGKWFMYYGQHTKGIYYATSK